jgi:hypothetical protein
LQPKHLNSSEYGLATAQFLDIAYKDYLGARVLLNAQLLVQGAVLASTAIEKYFKALLAFRGHQSHGHLKKAHINAAKNFDSRLAGALNEEFLALLQRAYSLRYLDDIPVDFNLVIASREFLAELDFTAGMFQESFTLRQDGIQIVQDFNQHKEQHDPRLIKNNFLFIDVDKSVDLMKQVFISAEPQLVYEMRNCRLRGLVEAIYLTGPIRSDGKFLRPAYVPIDTEEMNFQLAFKPLPPEWFDGTPSTPVTE